MTTLALAIATAEAAAMIAGSWTLLHTAYGVILGVLLFLLHAGAIVLNIARGNRLADCGCAFCD